MNKKIISPVIAIVILIVIAAAISFVVYMWIGWIQEDPKDIFNIEYLEENYPMIHTNDKDYYWYGNATKSITVRFNQHGNLKGYGFYYYRYFLIDYKICYGDTYNLSTDVLDAEEEGINEIRKILKDDIYIGYHKQPFGSRFMRWTLNTKTDRYLLNVYVNERNQGTVNFIVMAVERYENN